MLKMDKSRNSSRSTLFNVTELTTVRFATSVKLVASGGMNPVLVKVRQVVFLYGFLVLLEFFFNYVPEWHKNKH